MTTHHSVMTSVITQQLFLPRRPMSCYTWRMGEGLEECIRIVSCLLSVASTAVGPDLQTSSVQNQQINQAVL